jgi:hypothetical protein
MTYDRNGNMVDLSDEEWNKQRKADIRIIHTGGDAPVVGEPSESEVAFRVVLDDHIMAYRLRVLNGWLQDVEMTREDLKDLLS